MPNEDIVDRLNELYQPEEVMLFCEMNVVVWDMINEDEKKRNLKTPLESEFEAKWWNDKFGELRKSL